MSTLDRRQMILGSGLVFGLTACESASSGASRAAALPAALAAVSTPGPFEEAWHHGDQNPKFDHPVPSATFDPPYGALLHLNLNSNFELEARRVHFRVNRLGANNTFRDNVDRFISWINYYNGAGAAPTTFESVQAEDDVLDNFAFNSQHHFLVYIRNSNIAYDTEWPVWFGKRLIGSVFGQSTAAKNYSFFGVTPKVLNVMGGSTSGIYLKNYYHVKANNIYRPINANEKLAYSLNINTRAQVAGFPGHVIPIIIDPDTGNMGEGSPFLDV
jgi:hypothetical protein